MILNWNTFREFEKNEREIGELRRVEHERETVERLIGLEGEGEWCHDYGDSATTRVAGYRWAQWPSLVTLGV